MRSEYVYIIWENPDYCYDGCCSVIAGVYTVKHEAEADLERLQDVPYEEDRGIQYEITRYKNGLQDR